MIPIWKSIDGYYYPYRINEEAEVEKLWDNGKWMPVPHIFRTDDRSGYTFLYVKLRTSVNTYRKVKVATLMANAFLGGKKQGQVVSFKNTMATDCSLCNIYLTTVQEVARKVGKRYTKPIEKIDMAGNVVTLYKSLQEASKAEFLSRDAIVSRCKKKVKKPYRLNGYTYRFAK